MVPWDKIAGGVLGAAAGLASPDPYGGTAFGGKLIDDKTSRDYAGRSLTRAEGWASGAKPIQSQATINRLTSGSRARLGSAAAGARENATERWIASGEGPASGQLNKRLAEIDRSLIDATRQTEAPLLGQMAQREPEFQMEAQGMMMPWLQHAEQMSYADWQRMEAAKAAQTAAGSKFYRGLAGAAAGWGGDYGEGGVATGGAPTPPHDTSGGWAHDQWVSPSINAPGDYNDWGNDGGVDDTQWYYGGQG